MAGVAGPMLRHARARGIRFLAGLLAGGVAAGLILALPVFLIGSVAANLPETARLLVLAAICLALGLTDLFQRTPQVWRQVPQALIRTLSPGPLGVAWGFDLGLLFTTQKTTSLIWVALAGLVLQQPQAALTALVGISAVATMAIVAASHANGVDARINPHWSRGWTRQLRRISGTVIVALAVATAAQGLMA